jgi:hypothetical protein
MIAMAQRVNGDVDINEYRLFGLRLLLENPRAKLPASLANPMEHVRRNLGFNGSNCSIVSCRAGIVYKRTWPIHTGAFKHRRTVGWHSRLSWPNTRSARNANENADVYIAVFDKCRMAQNERCLMRAGHWTEQSAGRQLERAGRPRSPTPAAKHKRPLRSASSDLARASHAWSHVYSETAFSGI